MQKSLRVLLLASISATFLYSAPASKEDILSFFEQIKLQRLVKQQLTQSTDAIIKKLQTKKEKDTLVKVVRGVEVKAFLHSLVPIYQKYYTKEDMEIISRFYKTPTGKKFIKNTPYITREVTQKNIKLTEQIMQEFRCEMMKCDKKSTNDTI